MKRAQEKIYMGKFLKLNTKRIQIYLLKRNRQVTSVESNVIIATINIVENNIMLKSYHADL